MTPRRLAGLALVFLASRILLVLCAADRIGEPDLAEVGAMALGDAWAGGLPFRLEDLMREVRAGPNAPHGGFVVVALLYAAAASVVGSSYFALKCIAVGFATAAFAAWTAVAGRLGGPRAAGFAALLLFLPPPSSLGGQLISWGSHPESAAILGVAAWTLLAAKPGPRGALAVGVGLGACLGFNRLTLALVVVLAASWAFDRLRSSGRRALGDVAMAAGAAAAVAACWLAVDGAWSASVTESPANTPVGLIGAAGTEFGRTLAGMLPLRVVPATLWSSASLADAAWTGTTAGLCLAAAVLGPRSGRRIGIVCAAAAGHLAFVALLAPQRPVVPVRYLLPLWPLLAVGAAVGLSDLGRASTSRGRAAAAVGLALILPGLAAFTSLLQPERIREFAAYQPQAYAPQDIGKVTYSTAPGVNDFLARRGDRPRGFRLAAGSGAGQDLLMRPPPHPVDAAAVVAGIERWDDERASPGRAREHALENLGWGLAVFAAERRGARESVLAALAPLDRRAVARGIGMGLRAAGRDLDLWAQDPNAAAVRAGATALEGEAARGASPPLPPAGSSLSR